MRAVVRQAGCTAVRVLALLAGRKHVGLVAALKATLVGVLEATMNEAETLSAWHEEHIAKAADRSSKLDMVRIRQHTGQNNRYESDDFLEWNEDDLALEVYLETLSVRSSNSAVLGVSVVLVSENVPSLVRNREVKRMVWTCD